MQGEVTGRQVHASSSLRASFAHDLLTCFSTLPTLPRCRLGFWGSVVWSVQLLESGTAPITLMANLTNTPGYPCILWPDIVPKTAMWPPAPPPGGNPNPHPPTPPPPPVPPVGNSKTQLVSKLGTGWWLCTSPVAAWCECKYCLLFFLSGAHPSPKPLISVTDPREGGTFA